MSLIANWYGTVKNVYYANGEEGVWNMITTAIGCRVRELRQKGGYSQETFSNKIGMARTYFAEVETGKRNISVRNLKKISDGLGVSLATFFDSPLFNENAVIKPAKRTRKRAATPAAEE